MPECFCTRYLNPGKRYRVLYITCAGCRQTVCGQCSCKCSHYYFCVECVPEFLLDDIRASNSFKHVYAVWKASFKQKSTRK